VTPSWDNELLVELPEETKSFQWWWLGGCV
jgi:hypothetical protein